MDECEILAIMFQVAPHAILAVGILHPEQRMVTRMRVQPFRDFLMAIEALERRRAGPELMAGGAMRRALQGLVRFRKGPRRNLAARPSGAKQESAERQQKADETRRIARPSFKWCCACGQNRHQTPPTTHHPCCRHFQFETR